MSLPRFSTVPAFAAAMIQVACATGGDQPGGDAASIAMGEPDSAAGDASSDAPSSDSGTPEMDSSFAVVDSGTHKDGGSLDSGSHPVDSGPPPDSGVIDSGHDSASTGAPATCAQAYGSVGCCASSVLYYCAASAPTTLKSTACTGGKVCGWDSAKSYYDCVAAPGGPDPSGANPIACQ
jgi:hypothetical protein